MRRRDVLAGVVGLPATSRLPTSPEPAGAAGPGTGTDEYAPFATVPVPRAAEAVVGRDGTTVYVAVHGGVDVVDVIDPSTLTVVASLRGILADRDLGPLRDVQDVAVDGDRLLVVGPAHARDDALRAAVLFDVSAPDRPSRLAAVETEFPIHNADLDGTTAYLTGNDGATNPLVIVDVANGTEHGRWSPVDADGTWQDVPAGLRVIHDVWVRDDRAYASYWDAGTWIIDVSDPSTPTALGRAGGRSPDTLAALDAATARRAATVPPGNHHSAATDPDGSVLAVGKESWAVDDEGGPSGIDLYDLGSTTHLSTIDPRPAADSTRGGVWTTVHNFEIRGDRLYSAWYQDGLRIHDIADPTTPVEVASWRDPERARLWTAQVARDAVIATSMGVGEVPASLFTFPIPESGPGGDVPALAPRGTAVAAVVGLAGAAWLAKRRRERD